MHGAKNESLPLNASTTTSADPAAATASASSEQGAAPVRDTTRAPGTLFSMADLASTTSESPTTTTLPGTPARSEEQPDTRTTSAPPTPQPSEPLGHPMTSWPQGIQVISGIGVGVGRPNVEVPQPLRSRFVQLPRPTSVHLFTRHVQTLICSDARIRRSSWASRVGNGCAC